MYKKGFTILELVIYIFIFSIILGSLVTLLYAFTISNDNTRSEVDVIDATHILSTIIIKIVRGAEDITFPPGKQPFDRLMLQNDGVLYRIDVDNGVARLKAGSGQETPITNNSVNIDDLTFQKYSFDNEIENVIRVKATISSTNPTSTASQSIDFWISSR